MAIDYEDPRWRDNTCVACIREERFADYEAVDRIVEIFLKWGWHETRACDYHRRRLRMLIKQEIGTDPGWSLDAGLPEPTNGPAS